MKVTIRIIEPAEIVNHTEVESTYVKDDFYFVAELNRLYRYRLSNVWMILEDTEEEKED